MLQILFKELLRRAQNSRVLISGEQIVSMTELNHLLEAAVNRDPIAVDKIAEEFESVIELECRKFGFWREADWSQSDMTQEVLMRVWSRIDQFRGASAENVRPIFVSWLQKVTKSVLANWVRERNAQKRKPDQPLVEFDEMTQPFVARNIERTHSPSSHFQRKEDAENLDRALLEVLDRKAVQILYLKIIEGVSLREISRRMGISYDSVSNLYHQSLKKLEKVL